MNTLLWIITGLLAAAFTIGALSQLLLTREKYRTLGRGQHWVDDFDATQLKTIGAVKLLGCAALIVPPLTPVGASALALFMAGAVTTRFRRHEWTYLPGDLAYLSLFLFVAWGRFSTGSS
ncbi:MULTISPECIES: DoxX family protein [Actinoplanes]|uniref:DoxX family protein n=1 Tax=Actinoplanes TaxID=1865 RepID=UPI0005F2982F|nr:MULTISPECIES: DoxX family protein [Actinoplanes]GLY07014.1 hypothetical protein Acsp01_73930 [Actinoplanes sp. NBRC 101535]